MALAGGSSYCRSCPRGQEEQFGSCHCTQHPTTTRKMGIRTTRRFPPILKTVLLIATIFLLWTDQNILHQYYNPSSYQESQQQKEPSSIYTNQQQQEQQQQPSVHDDVNFLRLVLHPESSLQIHHPNKNDQLLHPLSTMLLHQEKIFLFVMGRDPPHPGYGSYIMSMLILELYFYDIHDGRQLVMDESYYPAYRWRRTNHLYQHRHEMDTEMETKNITQLVGGGGMYSGFFQTTFPVLQNSNQEFPTIRRQVVQEIRSRTNGKQEKTVAAMTTTATTKQSMPTVTITTNNNYSSIKTTQTIKNSKFMEDNYEDDSKHIMNHNYQRFLETNFWNFTEIEWCIKPTRMEKRDEPLFRKRTLDDPVIKVSLLKPRSSFGPTRNLAFRYFQVLPLKQCSHVAVVDEDSRPGASNSTSTTNTTTTVVDDARHCLQSQRATRILFYRMSHRLCQSMGTKKNHIQDQINQHIRDFQVPDIDVWRSTSSVKNITSTSSMGTSSSLASPPSSSSSSSSSSFSPLSVAFHIRRGDKVIRESRKYEAVEYVNKLVQEVAVSRTKMGHHHDRSKKDVLSRILYCFVATDDYSVITELQRSLTNASIPCTLYTMTPENYETTRQAKEFVLFLAQLEILIHATYFIGTFNSNVGRIVALYRGCQYHNNSDHDHDEYADYKKLTQVANQPNNKRTVYEHGWKNPHPHLDPNEIKTKFDHYYRSYGVDTDDWYIY